MASIDLNIVERGKAQTTWQAEGTALSADKLDEVVEQKTDNSSALNSLPTPFARFFVAEEAFRRLLAERKNSDPSHAAGFAYRQLASDILDVYELLFFLQYHRNQFKDGQSLALRPWDSAANIKRMKGTMPVLHNAMQTYYATDIAEQQLYFLVYTNAGKDMLLACSSPLTGFVTPPDMDKARIKKGGAEQTVLAGEQYAGLHLRRKEGGEYFRDVRMFEERDADFKNYMFNHLFGPAVNPRLDKLNNYVRDFGNDPDIRADWKQQLSPVLTADNDALVVGGLPIMQCAEVDANRFFADAIVRLPYRIDRTAFEAVVYENDPAARDYDYLLPFRPEMWAELGAGFTTSLHVESRSVTAKLHYGGKTYQKTYSTDAFIAGHGRIVCLGTAHVGLCMGVFPNILSARAEENNYFKVMLAAADADADAPQTPIDSVSLRFFCEGAAISEVQPEDGADYGVKPAVVRSCAEETARGGTKYYELFNTSFDMVEISVAGAAGVVRPVWQQAQVSGEEFTYAIDLGTTGTFMARCMNDANGQPDLGRKPQMLVMDKPMVNYLHEASAANAQFSLVRRIEDAAPEGTRQWLKTEFAPALIDGKDYVFPLRTALCVAAGAKDRPALFDSHNIAFFYEKTPAAPGQTVDTDIKWKRDEQALAVFVRELLLIVKCDILQHNGDMARTRLVWFSPLSFSGKERDIYRRLWEDEPKRILCLDKAQVRQYSESEAPYYYYKKMNYIANSDAVAVIDIGGGSTDFVYFADNKPQAAASAHFGCDVLWENGFNEFADAKDNGIYCRYAGNLHFQRKDVEAMNAQLLNQQGVKTRDIINFWLRWSEDGDVASRMRADFRPVFVYHLTAILYYMARLFKAHGMEAPRAIMFSGNGSRYIDTFIDGDPATVERIVKMVFGAVFGGTHHVHIQLPPERKEATCYGGLYRDVAAVQPSVMAWQGDAQDYATMGDIDQHYANLRTELLGHYATLAKTYESVLAMLTAQGVLDATTPTAEFVRIAGRDMGEALDTYYKKQVKEKYRAEQPYNDSIFFLPIIQRVLELTQA